jgi:AraC family transcriptional regulator
MQRSGEITSRLSPAAYGLVVPLGENEKSHPDEMFYVAGASVTASAPVPPGMTRLEVPTGKYAVFIHKGPLENLAHTTKAIYAEWFPRSCLTMRRTPHLEIYDSRFNLGAPDSEFDICVPVEA